MSDLGVITLHVASDSLQTTRPLQGYIVCFDAEGVPSAIKIEDIDKEHVGLSNVGNIKSNFTATRIPGTTDNATAGYSVGSRWVYDEREWVCVSAVGSAIWIETTAAGGGGGGGDVDGNSYTIQVRGYAAATWTSDNPVLAARELAFEIDTGLAKWGDGATAWTSLPYAWGLRFEAGYKSALDGATNAATPATLALRDISGRFRAEDPSDDADVATKGWTDGVIAENFSPSDRAKFDAIESGAEANPAQITSGQIAVPTDTDIVSLSPADVAAVVASAGLTPDDYGEPDGVCQLDDGGKVSETNMRLAGSFAAATTLTGGEYVWIEQGGEHRRTLTSDIASAGASVPYTSVISVPTARLVGRGTSGTGAAEAITLGTHFSITGGALTISATSTPTASRIPVADGSGKLDGWITAGAAATHASNHKSGGSDAIKLDELAAPTDVTTLNATTSAHGLLKKLSNVSTEFLNGQGNWATPSGSGAITSVNGDSGPTVVLDAADIAETTTRKWLTASERTRIADALVANASSPVKPQFIFAGTPTDIAAFSFPAGVPGLIISYDDLFFAVAQSGSLPATSTTAVNVTTTRTETNLQGRFIRRRSNHPGIAGNTSKTPITALKEVSCRLTMSGTNTIVLTPDQRVAAASASSVALQVVDYIGALDGDYALLPVGTSAGLYAITLSAASETGTLALGLTLSAGDRNRVLMDVVGLGNGGSTARILGIAPYLSNTSTLAAHSIPPAANSETYDVSLVLAAGDNWRVRYALISSLTSSDTGNITIYDGQPVGWNTSTNTWDTTGLSAASISNWDRTFIWSSLMHGPESGTLAQSWMAQEVGALIRRGTTADPTNTGNVNYEFSAIHTETGGGMIVCLLEDVSPASSVSAMRVLRVESNNATGTAYPTAAIPVVAGTGYAVSNTLTGTGGTFTVTAVDSVGGVTSVDVLASPGAPIPLTLSAGEAVTGGSGTGCQLRIAYDFYVDIRALDLLEPEGALTTIFGRTETIGTTTAGFTTHLVSAEVVDRATLLVRRPPGSAVIEWVAEVARLPRPTA